MSSRPRKLLRAAIIVSSLAPVSLAFAQADRLCVVRVGGTAALTNASTAAFLDCFTLAGAPAGTTSLPTAEGAGGAAPLTLSGSATSEGQLRLSSDGRYLTVAGYGTAPGMVSVVSSPSATVNRAIARIDALGTVDTTTRNAVCSSGNNIRGVISDNGTRFWTTGTASSNGGIQLATFGSPSTWTQIAATPTNVRVPGIFAGQLFLSSASGAFVGVSTVGTGTPTTTGQTVTLLPGLPGPGSPSPYAFVAFDLLPGVAGLDTLYVADNRSAATGGGIQKWVSNGSTWILTATFAPGTVGARGLTGRLVSGMVTLYATTAESVANTLVTVTDNGAPTFTVLGTAAANTVFRGVDFAPVAAPAPVPASSPITRLVLVLLAAAVGVAALRRKLRSAA